MRIGFETILGGNYIYDLDATLATIAQAGFQGVEFFQQHHNIQHRVPETDRFEAVNIADVVYLLKKHHLVFLGLTSGRLKDRVAFCSSPDEAKLAKYKLTPDECWPLYFYIERLEDAEEELEIPASVKLALHSNSFKPLDSIQEMLDKLGDKAARFCCLPDTAHMYIVGKNPVTDICALPKDRVIAVHIKDWNAAYGRSSHRSAKGFTSLGKGDVPLTQTLEALRKWDWDGWLVYEQDYPDASRRECITTAVEWFAKHKLMPPLAEPLRKNASQPQHPWDQMPDITQAAYTKFVETLSCAGSVTLTRSYRKVAEAVFELFAACHVAIWSYNVTRPEMCLLAEHSSTPVTVKRELRIDRMSSPIGRDAEAMQSVCLPLTALSRDELLKTLQWGEVIGQYRAQTLLGIPIPNRYNPNQVRFVVGILLPGPPPPNWDVLCRLVAKMAARPIDAGLDDACAYATERVNFLADRADGLDAFLTSLHTFIQEQLDCQGVALLLSSRDGERLEARVAPTTQWERSLNEEQHYYIPSETRHPTCQCWQNKKIIVLADARALKGEGGNLVPKSFEYTETSRAEQDSILLVPLLALKANENGKQEFTCLGVIRCRNKKPLANKNGSYSARYFTDDDAALCNAICAAAVPHIELWEHEEWEHEAFSLMIHELHFPINMTKQALRRLVLELSDLKPNPLGELQHPTHERIASWITLMQRVVGSADELGFEYDYMEPEVQLTRLLGEVVAPAVAQVRRLVQRRRFDPDKISYSGFDTLPALYIDVNLFQQVLFNLFSNTIKFAFDAPELFKVELGVTREEGWFHIYCRDWGPGIAAGYETVIFERGKRGPKHMNRMVPGVGAGLWIIKRIVEKHGGYVCVTRHYRPTEISLFLPSYLEKRPHKI